MCTFIYSYRQGIDAQLNAAGWCSPFLIGEFSYKHSVVCGYGSFGDRKTTLMSVRCGVFKLYCKPGILFMDEATNALDEESEACVNQAIKKLNIT